MTRHASAQPQSPLVRPAQWARSAAPWLMCLGLVACGAESQLVEEPDDKVHDAGGADSAESTPDASDDPSSDEPEIFTIVGAGDVLTHDQVVEAAEALADEHDNDEEYVFAPLMAGVEPWIAGADLALCGLEVPIVASGRQPSGYPVFAAPEELISGLAETGFDGCSIATNHALDAGPEGVGRTLDVLDDHELGHVGTARTEEEAAAPQLYTLTRDDIEITVAHLATTQIHNDDAPADSPWMVAGASAKDMTEQAGQARDAGADIVVVSVHWGQEYHPEPDEAQRAYGEELVAGGEVDLVLGSHPHTPQPLEKLDGGPHDEGMWVAWSMGNFLANQDEECCVMETATGVMVFAEIEAGQDQIAHVTEVAWSPATVDRSADHHRGVWPLAELSEDGSQFDEVKLDDARIQDRWDRVREVVGEEHLWTEPPEPSGQEPDIVPRQP